MTPMPMHVWCFITAACAEEPKLDKLLVFSTTSHFVLAEALVFRSLAEFLVMLRSCTAHHNFLNQSIQPSSSLRNCTHLKLTHITHVESFFTSFTKLVTTPGQTPGLAVPSRCLCRGPTTRGPMGGQNHAWRIVPHARYPAGTLIPLTPETNKKLKNAPAPAPPYNVPKASAGFGALHNCRIYIIYRQAGLRSPSFVLVLNPWAPEKEPRGVPAQRF